MNVLNANYLDNNKILVILGIEQFDYSRKNFGFEKYFLINRYRKEWVDQNFGGC